MAENITEQVDGTEELTVDELKWRVAELEEQWDQAAAALLRIRAEDKGWRPLSQIEQNDGFSIQVIKEVGDACELQAVGNPLLKRGLALRHDGVFSKGFRIQGNVPPRYQRKLDKPSIQRILMSAEGLEKNDKILFARGNFFFAYNTVTEEGIRIPFKEILNRAVDPDDNEVTAYYLRQYTRNDFDGSSRVVEEWLPTVEWVATGRATETTIANHPVNSDWIVVDLRVNTPTGGHWGIPDAFAALPYAWAYSEYIRDASGLLKALNTIAWKVVGKNKTQAQQAGVRLSEARQGPGTAVLTPGSDLQAVPRAGQVDMNDGVALGAMVASALEVPVNALLSNPGVGGGYGAVASLDGPTVAMARARQKMWTSFYERVFQAMGLRGLSIDFPRINEDPVHRQVSSLATGRATGAIWADEYRAAFLEATDVTPMHDEAPEVVEYAQAQNALGFLAQMMGAMQPATQSDPLARQGNSGVAGVLGDIDNTNRDLDTQPGTGSMTDLTG